MYLNQIDPSTVCRICLEESTELREIFRKEVVTGTLMPMAELLKETILHIVEPNAKLPSKMCRACKQRVCELYAFKVNALKCNNLMLELFSDNDKTMQCRPQITTADGFTQTDDQKNYPPKCKELSILCEMGMQTEVQSESDDELKKKFVDQTVQTDAILLVEEVPDNGGESVNDIEDLPLEEGDEEYQYSYVEVDESEPYPVNIYATKDEVLYQIDEDVEITEAVEVDEDVEITRAVDAEKGVGITGVEEGSEAEYTLLETLDENEDEIVAVSDDDEHVLSDDEAIAVVQKRISRRKAAVAPINFIIKDSQKTVKTTCTLCKVTIYDTKMDAYHSTFHTEYLPEVAKSIQFYRCMDCCTIFLTANRLRDHFNTCDGAETGHGEVTDATAEASVWLNSTVYTCARLNHGKTFSCDDCGQGTTDYSQLLRHFDAAHKGRNARHNQMSMHRCSCSSAIFDNLLNCLAHCASHLFNLSCPKPACKESKVEPFSVSELFKHVQEDHFLQHICNFCNEGFPYHIWSKHVVICGDKHKYTCPICKESFRTSYLYNKHRVKSHNLKSFNCSECDKDFSSKHDLHVHQRIHTNERPFKCSKCGKTFKTMGQHTDHQMTHITVKTVQCKVCHEKFKSARTLRGHMNQHIPEKNHTCRVCGKLFKRATHVKSHMRVHDKPKEELLSD